jgi:hypothetical protein
MVLFIKVAFYQELFISSDIFQLPYLQNINSKALVDRLKEYNNDRL